MKTIRIGERELQYEVFDDVNEYDGVTYETAFYEGTTTVTKRKYLIFGEKITKFVPNEVFRLYFNIEDERMTKSEVRAKIVREVELLDRKEQIEKGEII